MPAHLWFKGGSMTVVKNGHIHQSQLKKEKGVFLPNRQCVKERKSWYCVQGLITTLGYISKESLELTIGIFKAKNYCMINLILRQHFLNIKEGSGLHFQLAKNRTQFNTAPYNVVGEGSNKRWKSEFSDFKCSFLLGIGNPHRGVV